MRTFDAIVIGSGQAGNPLAHYARRAADLGVRVGPVTMDLAPWLAGGNVIPDARRRAHGAWLRLRHSP